MNTHVNMEVTQSRSFFICKTHLPDWVLGDNWLLTAGHCIEDLFIQDGKYDITRKTKYGDLQVYMDDIPYDEESYFVSIYF